MSLTGFAQKGVTFVEKSADRRIDVLIDGQLFTSYMYPTTIAKPVLYPLQTVSGKTLTRGFPLEPRAGERVDHPHHVGHWFNYGDVNGLDFWNNSEAIPEAKRNGYGSIYHQDVIRTHAGKEDGELEVLSVWKTPDGTTLLNEQTTFVFAQAGNTRSIERTTTLTAIEDVNFDDNKEGVVAIRVTRALELPSDSPAIFTDAQGNPTEVKVLDNDGVAGNYLSSEGLAGNEVWGTRAKWVKLYGKMDGEPVALAILDHPDNVGYPTYWHARGYGLFSANPLGQSVFSEGKEALNFKLAKGESATFRYKILVHAGSKLTAEDLEAAWEAFAE